MFATLARLRTVAVVALLGIAVTHVFELPDKLEESGVRYQGFLFIALIAGCVLLAALARRAPARPWWIGVLALSALPLIAYVISRSAGLPGGEDDIGAWTEPSGVASLAFEALGIVVAARALPLASAARARVFARPARRATLGELLRGQ
jgi:asparagine N-glycosylation enzyme membrane subunit Stt3